MINYYKLNHPLYPFLKCIMEYFLDIKVILKFLIENGLYLKQSLKTAQNHLVSEPYSFLNRFRNLGCGLSNLWNCYHWVRQLTVVPNKISLIGWYSKLKEFPAIWFCCNNLIKQIITSQLYVLYIFSIIYNNLELHHFPIQVSLNNLYSGWLLGTGRFMPDIIRKTL